MAKININPALIAYHEANRCTEIFNQEGLLGKMQHTQEVVKLSKAIAVAQNSPVNLEFLEILAEHHDDGRADQFRLLGKFWDTEVSHNALGLDRLEKFLAKQENFKPDFSVDVMRDVMMYHGRQWLSELHEKSKLYVDIITAADDFENALSCVSYLVKEVEGDVKGYIAKNPEADQKAFSDFVWEHFKSGEKFDKMIYCTTYAEYILFAATLATSCIKRYGVLAKTALHQPGYGYPSILEGFKDVFSKTLYPEDADKAYHVLEDMIN